jgi:hypothetical protein
LRGFCGRHPCIEWGAALTILIGALAISGYGLLVLVHAFFVEPDAQSGLVFIFLPFWQLAGALLLYPVALYAGRIHRRTHTTSA